MAQSKVVLITGTSSGLGLSTAILLAEKGFKVYASMRNLDKQTDLLAEVEKRQVKLSIVQLDVCDTESIQKCVDHIIATEGAIDILINNAGAGFAKSTEQASLDEIKWVTDVNYLSVVQTTKAVLPYMREKRSGHIINITSVGGLVGQPFNELYCASKFAVEGYTEALASYVTHAFNVKFSIVEPGGISTKFFTSAAAKTTVDGSFIDDEYLPILQQYLGTSQARRQEGDASSFQSAEQVAEVVVGVVLNDDPPLRVRTSEWAEELCTLKTEADPDGTKLVAKVEKQFLNVQKE